MRRARKSGAELGQCRPPAVVVDGTFGELRLQVHRGQRRSQLVCGVGDERALRTERTVEAGKQPVQRVGERSHFVRQSRFVDRLEPARRTLAHGGGEPSERREAA